MDERKHEDAESTPAEGGAGRSVAGLAAGRRTEVEPEYDERYREHYEGSPERLADRSYRQVRPAYQLGHFAGRDPRYLGRDFEEVEPELQHAWLAELRDQHGEWEAARRFVRHAWEHVRGQPGDQQGRVRFGAAEPIGGTERGSHERASFSDPIAPGDPDGVMGAKE